MSETKMPKRWSVGNYDGYMVERDGGDYFEAEDVEPLVAEITRLRADRRERIATAFMAAFLPQKGWDYLSPNHAAKDALRYADALIEEIDKESKP
jgi:hypothetical protein